MKLVSKWIYFCDHHTLTVLLATLTLLFSVIGLFMYDELWLLLPFSISMGYLVVGTFMAKPSIIVLATLMGVGQVQAAEKPSSAAGPVAVGVVVVALGGAFAVWAIKYCQKHYNKPPKTNDLGEFRLAGDVEVEYAASSLYQDAYCWQDLTEDYGPPSATLTTMHVNVTESSVWLSDIRQVPQGSAENYAEFKGELLRLGLDYSAGVHYALNGQPAQQWDVPVRFAGRGVIPHVIHGDGTVRTIIEWSPDLEQWYPKMTNSTGIMRFQFNDVSDTPCGFWRVTKE